jgi:2-polyprenyl-3-methyl-5-hydroxy-6-metoxy-1,4-benzoquinol methylase
MEFITKKYVCSLCRHDETKPLLVKQGFSIVKCSHCDFVYVNPRVENEQLGNIYKHHYFKNKDYGYIGYRQEKRLRIKNFERWLKDAAQFIPDNNNKPLNALDIGCAAGYCLDAMKAKGWMAEGIELDEEMVIDLNKAGHIVSQCLLENFEREEKFQIITLFDVIEHIPNIDIAFKKLNELIDVDGIVIMVTPNYNSLQRKLFKKRWFQYKPIEHIQYFTKQSLTVFAERNNLKMVYCTNCGQYADTEFLVNRLNYYHLSFFSKAFDRIFNLFKLRNRLFYTDTGSLFVIFKKK